MKKKRNHKENEIVKRNIYFLEFLSNLFGGWIIGFFAGATVIVLTSKLEYFWQLFALIIGFMVVFVIVGRLLAYRLRKKLSKVI